MRALRRAVFAFTLIATGVASTSLEPSNAGFMVVIVSFGVVGLVLTERRPENSIGSIFLGVAALWSLSAIGEWYGKVGVERGWPLVDMGPIMFAATFFPALALAVMALVALFPTGRLLSSRWTWVLWCAAAFGVIGAVGNSLLELGVGRPLGTSLVNLSVIPLLAGLLGGITSLVVRYRRGSEVERHQLKWFLSAVLLLPVALMLGDLLQDHAYLQSVIVALGLLPMPIAVAVAILRYRLYEIDRIISRTVSYLVVVGLLAAVFFGLVAATSSLLETDSDLVIAASTLAVAALFNPLRKRVQTWVDRRFNRSRYDAQKVMDGFSGSLRDQVDPVRVIEGWVGVVSATMQPAAAGVWVRQR